MADYSFDIEDVDEDGDSLSPPAPLPARQTLRSSTSGGGDRARLALLREKIAARRVSSTAQATSSRSSAAVASSRRPATTPSAPSHPVAAAVVSAPPASAALSAVSSLGNVISFAALAATFRADAAPHVAAPIVPAARTTLRTGHDSQHDESATSYDGQSFEAPSDSDSSGSENSSGRAGGTPVTATSGVVGGGGATSGQTSTITLADLLRRQPGAAHFGAATPPPPPPSSEPDRGVAPTPPPVRVLDSLVLTTATPFRPRRGEGGAGHSPAYESTGSEGDGRGAPQQQQQLLLQGGLTPLGISTDSGGGGAGGSVDATLLSGPLTSTLQLETETEAGAPSPSPLLPSRLPVPARLVAASDTVVGVAPAASAARVSFAELVPPRETPQRVDSVKSSAPAPATAPPLPHPSLPLPFCCVDRINTHRRHPYPR